MFQWGDQVQPAGFEPGGPEKDRSVRAIDRGKRQWMRDQTDRFNLLAALWQSLFFKLIKLIPVLIFLKILL